MKNFTAEKNEKLGKFLLKKYGVLLSFSTFNRLLRNKDIKVNGKRVSSDVMLLSGDTVEVYYDGAHKKPEVVFLDQNLIILVKPSGITSYDFESEVKKEYPSARLVHRLDRNTSGLIIFALNATAEKELLKVFKKRQIEKYYYAQVYGVFDKVKALLKGYLVKDEKASEVRIYDKQVKDSVYIETFYQTIEKYENSSLLKVRLITGKTHQIRAHLAHFGHFIIGDQKYGDSKINKKFNAKYQRLCACKITFIFDKTSDLFYLNEKTFSVKKPW